MEFRVHINTGKLFPKVPPRLPVWDTTDVEPSKCTACMGFTHPISQAAHWAQARQPRGLGETLWPPPSPKDPIIPWSMFTFSFHKRRIYSIWQKLFGSLTQISSWPYPHHIPEEHLTSSSLKTAPTYGWMRPSWQHWRAEDRLLEKTGKFRSWYRPQYTPMAEIFFRSRRLAGTEAMVPPAKPTTTILPSHARLRKKGEGKKIKIMYTHIR